MWSELWRLRGVLVIAAFAVATLWLGAVGKLVLYIHPRYELFTLLLAGVALLGCAGAVVVAVMRAGGRRAPSSASRGRGRFSVEVPTELGLHDHDHDHDHDPDPAPRTVSGRLVAVVALGVCAAVTLAALLLPPVTLSSATAVQRDIAGGAAAAAEDGTVLAAATGGSSEVFASFTVRDWATLLHQTADPGFYAGKPVDIVGFVTPHPDDPELFFVSRFAITCCAIDAMPFGVPVILAGWDDDVVADSWVRVTGEFVPATGGGMALEATGVTVVDEPAEPYLY